MSIIFKRKKKMKISNYEQLLRVTAILCVIDNLHVMTFCLDGVPNTKNMLSSTIRRFNDNHLESKPAFVRKQISTKTTVGKEQTSSALRFNCSQFCCQLYKRARVNIK